MAGMRSYYERWAEPWEFQALLKVRHAVGDPAVGSRFLALVEEVLWPETLNPDAIRSIRSLKARVEDTADPADLKRGPGGIRDVEFTVQVQQLIQQGAQGQGGQGGTVAVNKATNTLIVSARQSVVDQITALIPALDRPTPQVTIQARILFVNRTQIEGLGVRYEIKDSRGTMLNRLTTGFIDLDGDGVFEPTEQTEEDVIDFSGNTISAVGNAAERIPNSTFEVVTTLILGRHSLITWLEAVERLNLSEVQAEPVVTVLDHRTARVQVGERTPIRVVDQGAGTAEGALTSSVTTEETGVILEVTPHVVGNQVRLQLHAERSLVLEASVDEGYRFGTQQTDTEILLDDGQTAVISGLTITDYLEERAGIPILMNLPLVGALFRRTLEQEVKQDLLIMVTPYIERAGGM